MLTTIHYVSIALTMGLVTLVGLFSVFKVKTAEDFNVGGRKLSIIGVTGAIIGSFAGGTVTIGTAQMAYSYGIGALWFTIGAGISCLMLALFLARPMREKEVSTVAEYLVQEYGSSIRKWVAIFTIIGMIIQVAVQAMAAVPVIKGMVPLSSYLAAVLAVLLIILYVIGGGIWGTSMVGLIKLFLLSVSLFAGGLISLIALGGLNGAMEILPDRAFSLFPRGIPLDLGGVFSIIVGFASTQAFLQPVFSGLDVRAARLGSFGAALLLPLYGLAGVFIGLFMSVEHPNINPAFALPGFFYWEVNPWLGGIANATLLISLILTGGALSLGVSTVLTRDVYKNYRVGATDKEMLLIGRGSILGVGTLVLVLVIFSLDTLILDWSYLSNALRGTAVFLPLLGAVFLSGRINPAVVRWMVILGPLSTLLWAFLSPLKIHPLFIGLPVAILCCLVGKFLESVNLLDNKKKERSNIYHD